MRRLRIRGDLDLDPELWVKAGVKATKPAAVLVPVVARPEPTVLLTLRTPELHEPFRAGRVSRRPDRSDRRKPARRGLARGEGGDRPRCDVRRADRLSRSVPDVLGLSHPAAAWRASIPDYRIKINPSEVADAFEVPLDFLMAPGNHQRLKREWQGIERQYYAMPFKDRYIWGVTAGILRNLYERIYAG